MYFEYGPSNKCWRSDYQQVSSNMIPSPGMFYTGGESVNYVYKAVKIQGN